MKVKYQVTLFQEQGKYRPVACIIEREQAEMVDMSKEPSFRKKLVSDGVVKIATKRNWGKADLQKYGYTKVKVRMNERKEEEQA